MISSTKPGGKRIAGGGRERERRREVSIGELTICSVSRETNRHIISLNCWFTHVRHCKQLLDFSVTSSRSVSLQLTHPTNKLLDHMVHVEYILPSMGPAFEGCPRKNVPHGTHFSLLLITHSCQFLQVTQL